ncbi:MAG: efflux RND transporter permease subunit [Alphaproteobacteria bacterium]|nr:efflux RND transporter permease subunit [Alphaproteobacteria bacterium]
MKKIIDYSLKHYRVVLLLFCFLVIAGLLTYFSIPKESAPDVKVPIINTVIQHHGIAPRDAENLLVKPLEEELRNIQGIKQMSASSFEGGGSVTLEFQAGYDLSKALSDVRQAVSMAKTKFPTNTEEPEIKEVNVSLFPVLVVHLWGNISDRSLLTISKNLQKHIEKNKSVLEAPTVGGRKEVVELLIDPLKLEAYGLTFDECLAFFKRNHVMVSSGSLETGSGKFSVHTPGLIKTPQELGDLPLKVDPLHKTVVRFKDVGTITLTHIDRTSYSRITGNNSIALEVSKRTGANIIKTIQEVRESTEKFVQNLSDAFKVTFTQDTSKRIYEMLKDLQNNILLAVILVMIVIVFSLGWQSSLLVGIAVPASFLMGIFILGILGCTLNIVVLFSLILSVGMLVDGAIIVVEYADRKMVEGYSPLSAYQEAATRMCWPVVSSTLTILLVFFPLLFWPGIIGQFMKYLPITLLATLGASLFVALILIPVLGALFAKPSAHSHAIQEAIKTTENGDLMTLKGVTGSYVRLLQKLLHSPWKVLTAVVVLLVSIIFVYNHLGKGVEFFPEVEPESAAYVIRARGNLSLEEKDRLVRVVESDLLEFPFFQSVSAQTKEKNGKDTIGRITVELSDWKTRPKANEIFEKTLQKVSQHPGIIVEIKKNKKGPSQGKNIQLLITGDVYEELGPEIQRIRSFLETVPGIEDIEDSRPLSGLFEWDIHVNRIEAAKFGLSVQQIGVAINALMEGSKIGSYRPPYSQDEIDIVLRFYKKNRTPTMLEKLNIQTPKGAVPLSRVATWSPRPKVELIERTDGRLSMTLEANVNHRYSVNEKTKEVQKWIQSNPAKPSISVTFQGEEEDQAETKVFLVKAFCCAIFLIVVLLLIQFNSFFSTFLVLSVVVLSTIGVLVGHLVMQQPFSIVMSGIGVIALAGIIVSNNIILIDTFDQIRPTIQDPYEAILRTAAQRLRPVILTKATTIFGLLPILFQLNLNLFGPSITFGDPANVWWLQLATAICFGVLFASLLTLVVTPCILIIRENKLSSQKI